MVKQIFSLHDDKALAFTQPFFMDTVGQATRALDGIVNSPETNVNKYPKDFKLYKLGTFDDNSGKLTSLDVPEFIAEANEFLKPTPTKD